MLKVAWSSDVVVAPSALHLLSVKSALNTETGIQVAAQNMWKSKTKGAYTGELCADMIVDAGINWVILGHSERRTLGGESSDLIAEKTKVCVDLSSALSLLFFFLDRP